MIERREEISALRQLLRAYPVVAIIGARQVGKTTLARKLQRGRGNGAAHFDLENPADLARLSEPQLALSRLRGLVVIDEIQRLPTLFPTLRVLADRRPLPARFLVLGSAGPQLLQQSSESLAGRIAYHTLRSFSLAEVGVENAERLWLRGGFPRAYLARSNRESGQWRREFVRTFLERDLPMLGSNVRPSTMRRFWIMLAHYHGQTWNSSELARAFGVADTTVRAYLDFLTSALVVRQLPPWHENIAKRQVKAPKIYLSDSGLLHTLLDIETNDDLLTHPKLGASWEGFALDQVVRSLRAREDECYFWATHGGAELDLLIKRGRRRLGFEFKHTATPSVTPSMRSALHDLQLERLTVIHAGEHAFPLAEQIRAIPLSGILKEMRPLA